MTRKQITIAIIIALSLLALGCSKKFKMHRESLERKTGWQFHHSDLQSTGKINGSYSGKLNVIWEESFGTKPSGPMSLAKGFLILPDSRKKIRFYESGNGDYRGFLRTKGYTGTGVVVKDSLGYYIDGPRKYTLRCVNLLKRKTIWEAKVKDATSGSIIVGNNLIVSLTEGNILAFDLITGEKRWSFETKERLLAPPSSSEKKILQSGANGTVFVLDSDDGQELFREKINGPILTSVAISGTAIAIDMVGNMISYDIGADSVIWATNVATLPIWSSPAVSNGRIFVASNTGELKAFNASAGDKFWSFDAGEVINSAPIVVGDYVIFGTMTGKLFSLNSENGNVVATRQLSGAISQNPVSDGRFIYVASDEGELFCLGDSNEIASLNK